MKMRHWGSKRRDVGEKNRNPHDGGFRANIGVEGETVLLPGATFAQDSRYGEPDGVMWHTFPSSGCNSMLCDQS